MCKSDSVNKKNSLLLANLSDIMKIYGHSKRYIVLASNMHQIYIFFFQDMYIYLSENEYYNNFDEESLFWAKKGLVYGDWEAGPNGDGSFSLSSSFPASEVNLLTLYQTTNFETECICRQQNKCD